MTGYPVRRKLHYAALLVAWSLLLFVMLYLNPAHAQTPTNAWCADKSSIAILGASSETGYATTGYPSGQETWQPTRYGWTTKLANDVRAEWGTEVANYAHNGAMATDYLPGGRWPSTVNATGQLAGTDLVLIATMGGNEFWSQRDPAQFEVELSRLVLDVRNAAPEAVVLLSIYPELRWQPNPWGGQAMTHSWATYASKLGNVARTRGTALLDLRQYIPPAAASGQPQPSPWSADGVHLNDAGNLAEYGAWWGWVSSVGSIC